MIICNKVIIIDNYSLENFAEEVYDLLRSDFQI
jgi:hypothetical protein